MSHHLQIVRLSSGRSLLAGFSLARTPSRRWLVFIPESGSDFHAGGRGELAGLVGSRAAKHFNFMVMNRPGLGPKGMDRPAFELAFRRKRRIEDTLRMLKNLVPRSHTIHLVGYSEGAYLAPQIGLLDSRVRSLTMIGGGTRGWLKEELSNASRRDRPQLQKKIKEILKHPSARRKWNGFSHATWHSYRGDHTLRALRAVQVPTLAILGARDRVIDLKSAIVDLVLVSEYQPIQVHIFGDCGHNFTKHWPQVTLVLGRFLTDQIDAAK